MPKGKRGTKPDPVEIRFHLQVRKDIAKTLTAKRYNEVYAHWVETGKLPDGFRVPENAAEWRNTKRPNPKWVTDNNSNAIATLLRRSLPAVQFTIIKPETRKATKVSSRRGA